MTTRDTAQIVVGAMIGAGLVAGALFLGRLLSDDEPGIRVKNGGSVYIETASKKGFDFNTTAMEFRTRNTTKGCFDLVVVAGSAQCASTRLHNVTGVQFRTSDTGGVHGIGIGGQRFYIKRGKGWHAKSGGDKDLAYGGSNVELTALTAWGNDASGQSMTLQCSFEGQTRAFDLESVNCQ